MIAVYTAWVTTVVLAIITARSSTDPVTGRLTCDRKVLNTYLHLTTTVALMSAVAITLATSLLKAKNFKAPKYIIFYICGLAILEMVSFFVAYLSNPQNLPLKYGALVLFSVLAGIFSSALVILFKTDSIINAFGTVVALLIIATVIAHKYSHLLKDSHRNIIYGIILVLAIADLILTIFNPQSPIIVYLLYGILVFVTISLVYRANDIRRAPCSEADERYPDYVRWSLRVLTSLRIIFNTILQLFGKQRRLFRRRR